jgi:hypothetical protein
MKYAIMAYIPSMCAVMPTILAITSGLWMLEASTSSWFCMSCCNCQKYLTCFTPNRVCSMARHHPMLAQVPKCHRLPCTTTMQCSSTAVLSLAGNCIRRSLCSRCRQALLLVWRHPQSRLCYRADTMCSTRRSYSPFRWMQGANTCGGSPVSAAMAE